MIWNQLHEYLGYAYRYIHFHVNMADALIDGFDSCQWCGEVERMLGAHEGEVPPAPPLAYVAGVDHDDEFEFRMLGLVVNPAQAKLLCEQDAADNGEVVNWEEAADEPSSSSKQAGEFWIGEASRNKGTEELYYYFVRPVDAGHWMEQTLLRGTVERNPTMDQERRS